MYRLTFPLVMIALRTISSFAYDIVAREPTTSHDNNSTDFVPEAIPPPPSPHSRNEYKYFSEPGSDSRLGHYDLRFFRGEVSNAERKQSLRQMMQAYLVFFNEIGLDTWIAHGTLLGWWWNGQVRTCKLSL